MLLFVRICYGIVGLEFWMFRADTDIVCAGMDWARRFFDKSNGASGIKRLGV